MSSLYIRQPEGRQTEIDCCFLFQYWHVYCEQLMAALGAQEPAVVQSSSNTGAPAAGRPHPLISSYTKTAARSISTHAHAHTHLPHLNPQALFTLCRNKNKTKKKNEKETQGHV